MWREEDSSADECAEHGAEEEWQERVQAEQTACNGASVVVVAAAAAAAEAEAVGLGGESRARGA